MIMNFKIMDDVTKIMLLKILGGLICRKPYVEEVNCLNKKSKNHITLNCRGDIRQNLFFGGVK